MNFFSEPQKYAGVRQRIEAYQNAEIPTNIPASQTSRIRIPSGHDLIDFRDCTLEFTATCSATGGTYARFPNPVAAWINRIRLLQGSELLDEQQSFGNLYSAKLMELSSTDWTTSLPITDGIGSQATRNAAATNSAIHYQIKVGRVFDIMQKIFPLAWLNGQLVLEILGDTANNIVETDGTNPQYLISNLQLHYAYVDCTDEYKALVNNSLANGGLAWTYKSYDNFIGTYISGANSNQQMVLPFKKLRLVSDMYFAINQTTIGTTTVNDKFITFQNYANFGSAKFLINGSYYPQDKQQNTYEAYVAVMEVFDRDFQRDSYYAQNYLAGNNLIIAQSFTSHPKHLSDDFKIQGINTATGQGNMVSEQVLASAIGNNQSIYHFAEYFGVLNLSPNGLITVIQ